MLYGLYGVWCCMAVCSYSVVWCCMSLYGCMAPGGRRDRAWHLYGFIQLYEKMYCPLLYGRIQRLCAAELAALAPFATRRMMAPVWFR